MCVCCVLNELTQDTSSENLFCVIGQVGRKFSFEPERELPIFNHPSAFYITKHRALSTSG